MLGRAERSGPFYFGLVVNSGVCFGIRNWFAVVWRIEKLLEPCAESFLTSLGVGRLLILSTPLATKTPNIYPSP